MNSSSLLSKNARYSDYLIEDGFTIFLMHGVISPSTKYTVRNYTHKHINANHFSDILSHLVANGHPVSMSDVVAATSSNKSLLPRSFAITFDDGFYNNYSIAAPILREYQIPAMFYVTSDFVEHNSWSWVDIIECVVENLETVFLQGFLKNLDGRYQTKSEKIALLDQTRKYVKGNTDIDPYHFAQRFCNHLGCDPRNLKPDPDLDQKMTWDQVNELHNDPLFEVGGHGKTHRILSYLDDKSLADEVITSLSLLRSNLDAPVTHFSYPEGLNHCFDQRVIKLLKENHICCSPSAEMGVNYAGDDLFFLKRILVV